MIEVMYHNGGTLAHRASIMAASLSHNSVCHQSVRQCHVTVVIEQSTANDEAKGLIHELPTQPTAINVTSVVTATVKQG